MSGVQASGGLGNIGLGVYGQANTLVSYEIVLSEGDFFVSVNGAVVPSECSGFSVDANDCFIFHHEAGDFVSYPLPDLFHELILSADKILFVRFDNGVVADSSELVRGNCHGE